MFGFFCRKNMIFVSFVLFKHFFITTFTISFMFDFIKNMNTFEQRTYLVCDHLFVYVKL